MKRRIFGLENEYGLTCTLNGQRRLSPDNVARYLFEKVVNASTGGDRRCRDAVVACPHRVLVENVLAHLAVYSQSFVWGAPQDRIRRGSRGAHQHGRVVQRMAWPVRGARGLTRRG